MVETLVSWGGRSTRVAELRRPRWQDQLILDAPCLAVGALRSYGDSCLPARGSAIRTSGLDRLVRFDVQTGELTAESGISLGEILQLAAARGWTLPVVPGTRFVTLGGAIANDVHGKNHHRVGSFGAHVTGMKLLTRSGLLSCSPVQNAALFRATIGGLGLTGIIVEATLQLRRRICAAGLRRRTLTHSPAELVAALQKADEQAEYTAAWVDCSASHRRAPLPGYVDAVRFAAPGAGEIRAVAPGVCVPDLGQALVRRCSVRLFNRAYLFASARGGAAESCVALDAVLFPLDHLQSWNRLYGPKGFFQFQAVIPYGRCAQECVPALTRLMAIVRSSGLGSPLAVIKLFGDQPAAGLLSFPRKGLNVAVDLLASARTARVHALLERVVRNAGGALYPAKDALMSPACFRESHVALETFRNHKEELMTSLFWERVVES